MKVKIKFSLALILSLLLVFTTVSPVFAGASAKIDYVALGDSGAAGVRAMLGQPPGWEEGSDYGYTDNIARWLVLKGMLKSFNEDYAISGNTAAELAVMTATKQAQNKLKKAELVTLTIGANDVLGPLYEYYYACVEGGVPLTVEGAMAAIAEIVANIEGGGGLVMKENYKTVLANVLNANPDAKIYVMGYYNPLPFLVDFGFDAAPYVMILNDLIKIALGEIMCAYPGASIEYIPTLGIINGINGYTGMFPIPATYTYSYAYGHGYAYGPFYSYPYFPIGYKYLYVNLLEPVADIHLTMLGYLKVAEAFINEIKEDFAP
jgi:lysophospholipase L1-like esterase